jgi:hypothetical protein
MLPWRRWHIARNEDLRNFADQGRSSPRGRSIARNEVLMRMPVDRRGKPRNIATENFTAERTKAVITRRKQDEMLLVKW